MIPRLLHFVYYRGYSFIFSSGVRFFGVGYGAPQAKASENIRWTPIVACMKCVENNRILRRPQPYAAPCEMYEKIEQPSHSEAQRHLRPLALHAEMVRSHRAVSPTVAPPSFSISNY